MGRRATFVVWSTLLALATALVPVGAAGATTGVNYYSGVVASWRTVKLPSPHSFGDGATYNVNAVGCASTSDCWLTVEVLDGQTTKSANYVVHFNGTRWRRVSVATSSTTFDGVACTHQGTCLLVGSTRSGRVALAFVSPTHHHVTVVGAKNYDQTDSVGCAPRGPCMVVATKQWRGSETYLIDGTRVTTVHAQLPTDDLANEIQAVTCTSASACYALGLDTAYGSGFGPYGAFYDGQRWRMIDYPGSFGRGSFDGVACPATGACVAEGGIGWAYRIDGDGQPGVAISTGRATRWSTLQRGLPMSQQLSVIDAGVSCLADSVCVVLANAERFAYESTVVNGRLAPFRIVRDVRLNGFTRIINDLDCVTGSFCVAPLTNQGSAQVLLGS